MEVASEMIFAFCLFFHRFCRGLVREAIAFGIIAVALSCQQIAVAQEVWEYSPYKVKIWLSVSPSLSLSQSSQLELQRKIREFSEVHFGPTWSVGVETTPDALFGSVLYRLRDLTVDQLLSRELVLVLGKSEEAKQAFLKDNPSLPRPSANEKGIARKLSKVESDELADLEAKASSLQSVRTLESAIERMNSIYVPPVPFAALQRDIVPFLENPAWSEFKSKLKRFDGGFEKLQAQLSSGEIIAALVQKMDLDKFKKVARVVPTRLPWQPEAMLKNHDKIYLASVDKVGELVRIQVKELDAFVRQMSETVTVDVVSASEVPGAIAQLARDCFTPVVRIEETDFKTAVLRVRAAGLLTREGHPAAISPGDVLMPVIRRDDSNGNPTVLQSIPFTFIAVTERIDSTSRLYGAILTANRGAISAAKNRRTQRVGLKVNPRLASTNLKLGVQRSPENYFAGAEVHVRTPGTEDLQLVGRTDWRGILSLSKAELPTIQYEPPSQSRTLAISSARQFAAAPIDPPVYSQVIQDVGPEKGAKPDATGSEGSIQNTAVKSPLDSPPKLRGEIKLHVPLYLYYIKNGETLLARLPIVTGLKSFEQADLPDDRRRLEAEGFLKGLQSEVLDLVVRRRILESRIKQKIKANELVAAESLLQELKRVKSYDKLNEQIEAIQQRAMSNDQGPVPSVVVKRIDKMVDSTRVMIQKYLQDTLVRDLEIELNQAK
jgi:hypothetical protein